MNTIIPGLDLAIDNDYKPLMVMKPRKDINEVDSVSCVD